MIIRNIACAEMSFGRNSEMRIFSSIVFFCFCGVASRNVPVRGRGSWAHFNGSEFYISSSGDGQVTYQMAKQECEGKNSRLARDDDSEINNFLKGKIKRNSGIPYAFFIGLSSPWNNETYVWEDGTQLTWEYWKSGEPNNFATETCATFGEEPSEYRRGFYWNNLACTESAGYICQKTGITSTTTVKVATEPWQSDAVPQANSEYSTSSTTRRREYQTSSRISVTSTSASANHDNGLLTALIGAIFGSILGILLIVVIICLCRKRLTSKTTDHRRSIRTQHEEKANDHNKHDTAEYAVAEDFRDPMNSHPPQSVDNQLYGMTFRSEGVYQTTVSTNQLRISLRDNEGHEYAALGTKNVRTDAEFGTECKKVGDADKESQKSGKGDNENTRMIGSSSYMNTDIRSQHAVADNTSRCAYAEFMKSNKQRDNSTNQPSTGRAGETRTVGNMEGKASYSTYSALHSMPHSQDTRIENDVYNVLNHN